MQPEASPGKDTRFRSASCGSPITHVLLDYGGYAVTFLVSQLSQQMSVSSDCSPAPSSWSLGRLGKGLSDVEGAGDVLLFKTELVRLGELPGVGGDAAGVLRRAGVAEGQVFALGPDGSYDVELNRFFRELDGWGVRSPNSVRAYARDLVLFGRFLAERRGGKSIWEAAQEDLRAYRRAQRAGMPAVLIAEHPCETDGAPAPGAVHLGHITRLPALIEGTVRHG